jgi:class 3 adenylate cyclase/tetratricopeptide (TPR) repeat protein
VTCPRCQQENPVTARFCGGCGARLDTSPQAYTPRHLAERILSSRDALEGERKQVTVLFADVQDFTGLTERMDPEDVHALMDEVFAVLLGTVHRYEGTINQFLGDGVMALFGAPVALEDHALRAVEAALEIQAAMAARADGLGRRFGGAPALRIGLNSGRVVVGKIGDDLRMDYTAQGDTVNLAARLQQLAEAGAVVMGPATRRLVADSVECVSLGPRMVKGRAAPVEAYRVVRALGRGELLGTVPERALAPFVGRQEELDHLVEMFDQLGDGQPRTAIVTGEAGVGKSRLLLELRRRIDQPRLRWFVGHCVPYGRSTPYRPIVKSIRAACGLKDSDPLEAVLATLDTVLAPLGEQRQEVAPVLRHVLGLQPSDAPLYPFSGVERRAALTRALDAAIEALATTGPLVLVWEDCQWLDPASADYLALISQRLARRPILVILSYRPDDQPRTAVRPGGEHILLPPLTAPQARTLVTHLAGEQLAPELVSLAVERGGGNPLFLEEVTRALLESGSESIPPTVEALLRARIDRLPAHLKVTLATAAVIGQEFARQLLEEVLGESLDLTTALRELVDQALLAESEVVPDVFRFRQPLLQEVAYEGWLGQRRKALHRRIGEAIERMYANRVFEHLEKLARHFTRSEEWERAIRYHRAAGRKAAGLCANQEAIQRFGRALEMLGRQPEARDRDNLAIDIRLDLCAPNLQLGRLEEVRRLCQEAETLAKPLGEAARLAQVYSHLSNYHYMKGEPETATEFSRVCLKMAPGADDSLLPHAPRQYLGTCYHVLGRYQDAAAVLAEHIELIEQGDEFTRLGPTNLSYVSSCGWLAFTLAEQGDFPRAHLIAAKGGRAAAIAGHAYVKAIASTFAGLVWHAQGEIERAVPILQQALETCVEHHLHVWRPFVGSLLGHACVLQGQVPHGLDLLTSTAALTERLQVHAYWSLWTARLAEALLVAGQLPKALETARRAAALAAEHKERGNHARALVVLGTAWLRLGPAGFQEARSCLQQGLAEAEELQMRPLVGRGYDVLGRLAAEQGDTVMAWQLRETSKTIRDELGLTVWWDLLLNPPATASERAPELRNHRRTPLSWPVTVNVGQRRLHLHTTNLSPLGAKIRSSEPLEVGTSAQLHFDCPDGHPLDVEATVSRADADGLVFAFARALDEAAQRSLRALASAFRPD